VGESADISCQSYFLLSVSHRSLSTLTQTHSHADTKTHSLDFCHDAS
jgi:hypothetical protein